MLHFSKIITLAGRKDGQGKPLPFRLKYVKVSTGEVVFIDKAVYTSSSHKGYMNIKILSSGQIRKIIIPLIIEFNGSQVYL